MTASRHFGLDARYATLNDQGIDFDRERSRLDLIEADFIIADLSFERPSCYYELGFAQALNKVAYLLAKQYTLIHHVMNSQDILYYADLQEYQRHIENILKNAVN